MLKIAIHFNNYNTLGHAVKVFSLVKKLKEHFHGTIDIFVVETGLVKINILPFSDYSTLIFYPISWNKSNINQDRENNFIFLRKALINFKPDIFITEYFPFNNSPDTFGLSYLAEYMKKKLGTKIVCSCTCLNGAIHTHHLIREIYDVILFHFPEEFSSQYRQLLKRSDISANEILNEFKEKIFFTGFLFDCNTFKPSLSNEYIRKKLRLNKEKLIVVSRGGGSSEYGQIIPLLAQIAKQNKDFFFLISTGLPKKSRDFIKFLSITKKIDNMRLATLIYPHFDDFLNECDLSINMAGYNTMVRLLYFKKRSIIIPALDTDQPLNARLLSRFIPSKIVGKKELKLSFFDAKLRQLILMKDMDRELRTEWFEGLDMSVRIIHQLR